MISSICPFQWDNKEIRKNIQGEVDLQQLHFMALYHDVQSQR